MAQKTLRNGSLLINLCTLDFFFTFSQISRDFFLHFFFNEFDHEEILNLYDFSRAAGTLFDDISKWHCTQYFGTDNDSSF